MAESEGVRLSKLAHAMTRQAARSNTPYHHAEAHKAHRAAAAVLAKEVERGTHGAGTHQKKWSAAHEKHADNHKTQASGPVPTTAVKINVAGPKPTARVVAGSGLVKDGKAFGSVTPAMAKANMGAAKPKTLTTASGRTPGASSPPPVRGGKPGLHVPAAASNKLGHAQAAAEKVGASGGVANFRAASGEGKRVSGWAAWRAWRASLKKK